MNVIRYKWRRGMLECESVRADGGSPETELRFDVAFDGEIELGKTLKKIEGKSCFFNTGSLKDGIYRPKIHLKLSVIEPEGFEISGGVPRLIPKDDAYIRELSRELDAMQREISELRATLSLHDKKINGNPIF